METNCCDKKLIDSFETYKLSIIIDIYSYSATNDLTYILYDISSNNNFRRIIACLSIVGIIDNTRKVIIAVWPLQMALLRRTYLFIP